MTKRFQRTKEDFTCQQCGQFVVGNGYTNHCPSCLWSVHVDINPGDRANVCGGAMQPVSTFQKHGEWVIMHRCEVCLEERSVRAAADDAVDAIAVLAGRAPVRSNRNPHRKRAPGR